MRSFSFDLTELPLNGTGVSGFGRVNGVYGSGYYGVLGNGSHGVTGNGTTYGVYGTSNLYGIYGTGSIGVTAAGGGAAGFHSSLPSNTRIGLLATGGVDLDLSTFANNQNLGLYAIANTSGGASIATAGYFSGNVVVTGTLSPGGAAFKIDHPLDPANKYLYHSFVESPDMLNIYNGVVTLNEQGEATVEMPGWFETLNRDFRYQLTAIGQPSPDLYIAEEVKEGRFKIAGGKAGQRVSWQLTGIRQDKWANANRIPVEEAKPEGEKGLYFHPELYRAGGE